MSSPRFSVSKPVNRLVTGNPKIGIRPTIDGRRDGVRESLENQTMEMARRVAALLAKQLRHADGTAVECVIADGTIGGIAEAARCEEKFAASGVGLSITVSPCWCYGSETMDMNPLIPKAIWGFNGTQRPGAVYLAALGAGHSQKGLPLFNIYGRDVQNPDENTIPDDVQQKLLDFASAGLAVASLRGRSYCSIGGVSMGIAGSAVDEAFFNAYLGMRVMSVDMVEITRRIERNIFDAKEYAKARTWTQRYCRMGMDANIAANRRSRSQKNKELEYCVKMTLIVRDLMVGNPQLAKLGFPEEAMGYNAIAAGFQGQRQWTDHYPNGDFLETILNSSFDWNGIRQPYIVATENDALNGTVMLMGQLLTGSAQIFADVRTYWSPDAVLKATGHHLGGEARDGILHLINSGSAALDGTGCASSKGAPAVKPWWEMTSDDAAACLSAAEWCPAIYEYFRGGGFSIRYRTRGGMPVTAARINLIRGLGPALQIAEGYTIDLPADVHDALDRRTNPTWPTTWFAPRCSGHGAFRDVYTVMNSWGANHCSLAYGHIGHRLITLASMLRIPVYMHNVPPEKIFRPGAWLAFGADEDQSADLAACRNFGPLYGKY